MKVVEDRDRVECLSEDQPGAVTVGGSAWGNKAEGSSRRPTRCPAKTTQARPPRAAAAAACLLFPPAPHLDGLVLSPRHGLL